MQGASQGQANRRAGEVVRRVSPAIHWKKVGEAEGGGRICVASLGGDGARSRSRSGAVAGGAELAEARGERPRVRQRVVEPMPLREQELWDWMSSKTTRAPRRSRVWRIPQRGARIDFEIGRGCRTVAYTPEPRRRRDVRWSRVEGELRGLCGYQGVRVGEGETKFGQIQVWPKLCAKFGQTKFGQDQVWPDQVWPKPSLAKCGQIRFGKVTTFHITKFVEFWGKIWGKEKNMKVNI